MTSFFVYSKVIISITKTIKYDSLHKKLSKVGKSTTGYCVVGRTNRGCQFLGVAGRVPEAAADDAISPQAAEKQKHKVA